MDNQIQLLRVVVASPGDVPAELDAVSNVVEEINRSIGTVRRVRLEVIRWETDTHPGFHPDGPQGFMDPLLRIEDSDLLIEFSGGASARRRKTNPREQSMRSVFPPIESVTETD